MPKEVQWLEKQGKMLGIAVFTKITSIEEYQNLTYPEFVLLVDFMYAEIFGEVYSQTYGKNKSTSEWNGTKKK